ncbi:MAG: hypothetical protein JSV93_00415 [Candidatus Omnitrophota bacterium]|nr:MAG: hypothetical protein JSV93_00415 [Candidatus Omnitrophota bacterium]
MKTKYRYEIDPHNRLVVKEIVKKKKGKTVRFRKTGPAYFRKVLDGRFRLDKNNILSYHVKAPAPRDVNIPHQVKLKGKWSLTGNHDLRLTLDKWGRQTFGDQLTLQGNIIDINKNSILFAVTTRTKEGVQSTYALKFHGIWQADKCNRLTFIAKKREGKHDILAFNGIWEINKNYEIIYRYQKAQFIRKLKKIHTLTFKGHWNIKDKCRISYIMDRNTNSVFNFRTGLGLFRDNYIKYEVGIGLSHRAKPVKQTITLFGKWKIKNTRLIFEVEYENSKVHAIIFGAEAKLTGKDTVSFKLRNHINKDISANLKLSHKILKGEGEAFIRSLKSKRESAIFAGAARKW